jgi:hypothetical protein
MKALLLRVGCIGLLDRPRLRRERQQILSACFVPQRQAVSNAPDNAPPRITYMRDSVTGGRVHPVVRPPRRNSATHPSLVLFLSGGSNAANHPPAGKIEFKSRADAGRVHWLVRGRRKPESTRSALDSRRATRADD